jgi:tetratricopeptide (TPR) repeat protein
MLQPISQFFHGFLDLIAFLASVLLGVLVNALTPNIIYFLKRRLPGDKRGNEPTRRPWYLYALMLFSILVFFVANWYSGNAPVKIPLEPMTGDYRVVVSNFVIDGPGLKQRTADEVALNIFSRVQSNLNKLETDLAVTVWGPDQLKAHQISLLSGKDMDARTTDTERLAEAIDADVVIYGVVKQLDDGFQVQPQLFVRSRDFYLAEEIVGQYDLGSPLVLHDLASVHDRTLLNDQLGGRTEALSNLILGLAYYSVDRDEYYQAALKQFQHAEGIEGWGPDQGQQVLYLMEGNAILRQKNPDLPAAEAYFRKSLEVKPDYSRAMLGLANVFYRRALLPMVASNQPKDVDVGLLNQATDLLQQANASPNQPPLANVPSKFHFEMGQIEFVLAYGGYQASYDNAISEFQKVIDGYAVGQNPRLKERAAEAHARLGLIYLNLNNPTAAVQEYQAAIEMLADHPDRQEVFRQRIGEINQQT